VVDNILDTVKMVHEREFWEEIVTLIIPGFNNSVDEIKRAADSVSLNIAEGSTGQSNPEFGRFLGIALRSNIEVVSCLYLAQRRGYIAKDKFEKIYSMCEEILVMINSLRKSLK